MSAPAPEEVILAQKKELLAKEEVMLAQGDSGADFQPII